MSQLNEICRTCACFPFCETTPENCKHYKNIVKEELRKIDERRYK